MRTLSFTLFFAFAVASSIAGKRDIILSKTKKNVFLCESLANLPNCIFKCKSNYFVEDALTAL